MRLVTGARLEFVTMILYPWTIPWNGINISLAGSLWHLHYLKSQLQSPDLILMYLHNIFTIKCIFNAI